MIMGKYSNFLSGIRTLEEVESPVNGKISVMKGLAYGTYIQVEGLTQSGGILKSVWRKPLKKLKNEKTEKLKNCLILGLGGGTVAGLVREFWPSTEIVGVDLDPIMIELGKKYLGLDDYNVKIFIDDAEKFLNTKYQKLQPKAGRPLDENTKYDLILVDLYIGREYPIKFESENYIHLVGSLLERGGVAIFNRLYYGEKRSEAVKFGNKLEKIFKKVDVVYPEANIMYLCSDNSQ